MSASRRFGGEMTEILALSVRPVSFVPGLFLVVASGLIGYLGLEAGTPEILVPLWMAFGAVVVVRFAMNAAYGDPAGGLFDTSGGPWSEVVLRAARMAILNLTWALPVGWVLSGVAKASAGMDPSQMPPHLSVLLFFAVGLIPPLVLILSVGCDSFVESLQPSTWSRLFAGRADELLAMFAIFIGGVSATTLGALILAYGIGGNHQNAFLGLLLVSMAWGLGTTHALLGRLVGGFLRAHGDEADFEFAPDGGPGLDAPDDEPFTPFDPDALGAEGTGFQHLQVDPDGERAARMAETDSLLGRLRANEHIEDDDVFLAHEDAVSLEATFGPHPQVLARVAILAHKCERDDAVDAGQRAAEAALKVSNRGVLADLFEEFGAALAGAWPSEEIPHMAASLAARDRHEAALSLYAEGLVTADKPLPVVKAMIQWADDLLKSEATAEIALRVYDTLEENQPEHPFADFVERGRQLAERKLQRVGA